MAAKWTAKQDRQYAAISKSCIKKRRCNASTRSARKVCAVACFGLPVGTKRNACIRLCSTKKGCKRTCNSLAAATVNKHRAKKKSAKRKR